MRRNGGGSEGIRGRFGPEERERGVGWSCLSNAEISLSTRPRSEPHMSFNTYADGQAVTQKAPIRASSG